MFSKDTDKDTVVLLAARASRVENQDAIDASIVGMLGDPKEVNNYRLFPKHQFISGYSINHPLA